VVSRDDRPYEVTFVFPAQMPALRVVDMVAPVPHM
jgi:hypothetical protein